MLKASDDAKAAAATVSSWIAQCEGALSECLPKVFDLQTELDSVKTTFLEKARAQVAAEAEAAQTAAVAAAVAAIEKAHADSTASWRWWTSRLVIYPLALVTPTLAFMQYAMEQKTIGLEVGDYQVKLTRSPRRPHAPLLPLPRVVASLPPCPALPCLPSC